MRMQPGQRGVQGGRDPGNYHPATASCYSHSRQPRPRSSPFPTSGTHRSHLPAAGHLRVRAPPKHGRGGQHAAAAATASALLLRPPPPRPAEVRSATDAARAGVVACPPLLHDMGPALLLFKSCESGWELVGCATHWSCSDPGPCRVMGVRRCTARDEEEWGEEGGRGGIQHRLILAWGSRNS